ncbi:hypothetical protein GKE82_15665 [Conexibacter sp. W3-3-2]|uniref:DUF3107 domain-containing protein n=1 Tax=Paraconexibacter algicola TaxID=2133960 RepID=A0A2T4UJD5_9ACTN|nr:MULTISPECIES: hypothetical protein [Solirubrobacterales]MTD45685.1 hypothetical protein [Conexibacter sp. W3-3-2]PTL59351.1 hypothetical protein C7Y72_06635 [Paraconexibacter algicola]
MADPVKRVSIGFHASPPLGLKLTEQALAALHAAVEQGSWFETEAEDAVVKLNTAQVLYVRVEKDEPRVGFGLGA